MRSEITRAALLVALLFSSLAHAGPVAESCTVDSRRTECLKDWTLLIYMSADNNLTPFAYWNIYAMEAAMDPAGTGGSGSRSDVLLQLDTKGDTGLRRIHVEESTEPFRKLTLAELEGRDENSIHSPVVQWLSEQDGKTEGQRLTDFLQWGIARYPSRHYMVVVWGHGQGWAGESRNHFGGLAFDDSTGGFIDIPALRLSLEAARQAAGHRIDVYASDACLMQMVEVASEISNTTDYIVGSATIQSYAGLPYREIISRINSEELPPVEVAHMIPRLYRQAMRPETGMADELDHEAIQYLTGSAIDSRVLRKKLVPALHALGIAITRYIEEDPRRQMDIRYIVMNTPEYQGNAQDVGTFLTLLRETLDEETLRNGALPSPATGALSDAVSEASDALEETVIDTLSDASISLT